MFTLESPIELASLADLEKYQATVSDERMILSSLDSPYSPQSTFSDHRSRIKGLSFGHRIKFG